MSPTAAPPPPRPTTAPATPVPPAAPPHRPVPDSAGVALTPSSHQGLIVTHSLARGIAIWTCFSSFAERRVGWENYTARWECGRRRAGRKRGNSADPLIRNLPIPTSRHRDSDSGENGFVGPASHWVRHTGCVTLGASHWVRHTGCVTPGASHRVHHTCVLSLECFTEAYITQRGASQGVGHMGCHMACTH